MKNSLIIPRKNRIYGLVILLVLGFTFSESASQCVTPPSGLVSWWPGEGNFNDIQDGNTGTNAGAVTFTTGKVGQAFSFNGASNSFITLPNSSNLLPASNQFTIDGWIKPDFSMANLTDNILTKRDGCDGLGISYLLSVGKSGIEPFGHSPGEIIFVMHSAGGTVELGSGTTLIPNDGQFHHVAGTYDGAFMMIYLDGQLVGQAARTGAITVSTSPVVIGSNGGTCSQRSVAAIDEIDFFDRALSAAELLSTYNAGSAGKCTTPPTCVVAPAGLVSWWRGEGNAEDSQDGNNGVLINGTTFASGLVGQAFSFNGVNDYISVPDVPNLDFAPTSSITVEVWVFRTGTAPIMHILGKRVGCGPSGINYQMALDPTTGYLSFGGDGGGISTGIDLPLNTWTYLAATFDGSTFRFYINGLLVATNGTGTLGPTNNGDFKIGGSGDCDRFAGLIDEVEIYNRALSASEIQAIYNAGSAGKCTSCTPPTAAAGEDKTICPRASVQIGGNPTGSGGTGTLTYSWTPTDGLNDATAANPTATPTSTTTYTVTVTDANGCTATDEVTVTVQDNQPPVITTVANPITLWPPNHQYVTINASQCVTAVNDNCATLSPSNVAITQVTSDEAEDAKGGGDGNTLNDMVIAANCHSVQLRSEREGSGNGRVYTIYLSINDGNGNTGTSTCLVTVPKSHNGNPAINDGPVYTVTGSCGGIAKFAENTSDETEQETLPEGYALFQNYPNPFNPSTIINFALPEAGKVTVSIYSETGQLVRTLIDNEMPAGQHVVSWNGLNESGNTAAAGVYLYRIVVQKQNGETAFTGTRRMTLLK